jgi:hypothetical protein
MLGGLLRYWNDKRGARTMPARGDVDPLEMGTKLLPHLLLCDLLDRGTRIRFRVVGTHVVKRLGFDPTGQLLAEQASGSYFEHLAQWHQEIFVKHLPLYTESVFRWGGKRQLEARHLLLPLTNGGSEPQIVLMGVAFSSDEAFPPQIRALNSIAQYAERCRETLPLPAPRQLDEAVTHYVA